MSGVLFSVHRRQPPGALAAALPGCRRRRGAARRSGLGVAEAQLAAVPEPPRKELAGGGDAQGVGVAERELGPAAAGEDGLRGHLPWERPRAAGKACSALAGSVFFFCVDRKDGGAEDVQDDPLDHQTMIRRAGSSDMLEGRACCRLREDADLSSRQSQADQMPPVQMRNRCSLQQEGGV